MDLYPDEVFCIKCGRLLKKQPWGKTLLGRPRWRYTCLRGCEELYIPEIHPREANDQKGGAS